MKKIIATMALSAITFGAQADDFDFEFGVNDDDFKTVMEDLGAALSYKNLNPAEPLGIVGFDVSLMANYSETSGKDVWERATGEDIDAVISIGAKVSKGLPLDFTISAFGSYQPELETEVLGAALSYASSEGGIIAPAIAVTAAATIMSGTDDLSLQTYSLDLGISKGFTILTPYGGVGYVHTTGETNNLPFNKEHDDGELKYYAGLRIAAGIEIVAEVDTVGDKSGFSIRGGVGF